MFLLRNGKKFIYHNGWWHGNRTAFYRLIDENVTIIALSNNDSKKVYSSKNWLICSATTLKTKMRRGKLKIRVVDLLLPD